MTPSMSEEPEDAPAPDWEDLFGAGSPENPAWVGARFLQNVVSADGSDDVLREMVAPETLEMWDFPWLRDFVASEPDTGVGGFVDRALGASDVGYMKLIVNHRQQLKPGSTGMLTVNEPTQVRAHIITLVWRSELGSWVVQGFGERIEPEAILSRTSPNIAPAIDRLAIEIELDTPLDPDL